MEGIFSLVSKLSEYFDSISNYVMFYWGKMMENFNKIIETEISSAETGVMLKKCYWILAGGNQIISKSWQRNVQFKHHKKDISTVLQSDEKNIGVGTRVGKVNIIKIAAGLGTSSIYYSFERKDDQVLKEKRKLDKVQ